jgi:hypothetical protein
MNSHWTTERRELDDDALLRALFAEGERPAHGDEAFVRRVMAPVKADAVRSQAWRSTAIPAVGAFGVAAMWPFLGPLGALFGQIASPVLQNAPMVSASGLSLLLALAIAGGAWLYADRS